MYKVIIIIILVLLIIVQFFIQLYKKTNSLTQSMEQTKSLVGKKEPIQKKPLTNIKKIGIKQDKFSGHLFHDIELIIILFCLSYKNNDTIEIYYIGNNPSNFTKEFCKLLFKKPLQVIKFPRNDIYIIDRSKLEHHSINKSFASYIEYFPYSLWAEKISPNNKKINGFKILYASRQTTKRKLTDESHQFLKNLVEEIGGTVIDDLGKFSLKEQIEIFRNHNCLIGVHGNNLSGLMWMLPGSFVFEILPYVEKYKVYDYDAMSMCMRHYYTTIDGSSNSPGMNWTVSLGSDQKSFILNKFSMLKIKFS